MNMEVLRRIIQESSLAQEEKEEFIKVLSNIPDKDLAAVREALEQSPEWVEVLYQNYLLKRDVIAGEDSDTWNKILQQEQAALRKIEY